MPSDSQRTYGIHIYTPRGEDPRIEVLRETVRTYENGDKVRIAESRLSRSLSEIATEGVPAGPVTVANFTDLRNLIAAAADAFAAADAAAAAAEEPPPNP